MKPIYVSSDDHRRLQKIINELRQGGAKLPNSILKLQEELGRALVLDSSVIPPQVVRIHSQVQLRDLQTDELEEWTLTLPEHGDPELQRLSVLAPIGTALLGFSEGDEIEWETPGGVRRLKLERVRPGPPITHDVLKSLFG